MDDELALVISSIDGQLANVWTTKKLKSYAEGDRDVLNEVWRVLADSGVFSYVAEGPLEAVASVSEFLGTKLLPGIVVTTMLSARALRNSGLDFIDDLKSGKIKVAISGRSDVIPEGDATDVLVMGDKVVKRKDATIKPLNSLDNSMRFSHVSFEKSETVDLRLSELYTMVAASIVGNGQASLAMAIEYSKSRIAFGSPIGSFQAVKHKLVNAALSTELSRSMYVEATRDDALAMMAKRYASRKIPKVIMDSIQVHGAIGFTYDLDLHLHLRRALTLDKAFPTKPSD